MPTFAAACNGATSLDFEGFCWWLHRVFCQVSEADFIDAVEELVHCVLMEHSVLLRVHLSADGRGEPPQLVSADPTSTVAQFMAMVAERVSDEVGVPEVRVSSLQSIQGEASQCSPQDSVRDLVAELGCTLRAAVHHPDGAELDPRESSPVHSQQMGPLRPQLFGRPSIALQIYQQHAQEPSGDAPSVLLLAHKLLQVHPGGEVRPVGERLYGAEHALEAAAAQIQDNLGKCIALCERGTGKAQQMSTVLFVPLAPEEECRQCALPQPAKAVLWLWGSTLVAVGREGDVFAVHQRTECRQLTTLPSAQSMSVCCSDGESLFYLAENGGLSASGVEVWRMDRDLQPYVIGSTQLPTPQAMLCHKGSLYVFASGLYQIDQEGSVEAVQVSGPDSFIIHSVVAAVSSGPAIYAIAGADSREVWEIGTDGACMFVLKCPGDVKALLPSLH